MKEYRIVEYDNKFYFELKNKRGWKIIFDSSKTPLCVSNKEHARELIKLWNGTEVPNLDNLISPKFKIYKNGKIN